jgi:hypothetical protein
MKKYKSLISQKSSQEEYEKFSEDANKYIEQLEQLNNEILRLNSLYESSKNNISPIRDGSNSPLRAPRARMAQNACISYAIIDNTGYTVTDVNGWNKNAVETVQN